MTATLIWQNGEPCTQVEALLDKGFMLGDGLFESIRIKQHKPLFYDLHLQRLQRDAERLALELDWSFFEQASEQFLAQRTVDGVFKIIVTAGEGGFGYQRSSKPAFWFVFEAAEFEFAKAIRLGVSELCLASQSRLAGIKHLSRIEQSLARASMSADYDDLLMLDHSGNVIETIAANIIVQHNGVLMTPALQQCGVAGVMREFILNKYQAEIEVRDISLEECLAADAILLCNSVRGCSLAASLNQQTQFVSSSLNPTLKTIMKTVNRYFE